MKRKSILFVISGPSGVGKGTLRGQLMREFPDIVYSISATTRPPRPGEVNGRDYFFISDQDFARMRENQEFLEYAQVYAGGDFYGTPRRFVEDTLAGGHDVLLEIDVKGARQVRRNFPEGVFIFIQAPSVEELACRLKGRGQDSEEAIARRLAACEAEMASYVDYDYVVVNDQVDVAVKKLMSIVVAERCSVKRVIADNLNEEE